MRQTGYTGSVRHRAREVAGSADNQELSLELRVAVMAIRQVQADAWIQIEHLSGQVELPLNGAPRNE